MKLYNALERANQLATQGEPVTAAIILLGDLKDLPTPEKRQIMVIAAENALTRAKQLREEGHKWVKSREKKLKALEASKKDGPAFDEQLATLYPIAARANKLERKILQGKF